VFIDFVELVALAVLEGRHEACEDLLVGEGLLQLGEL